MAQINCWFCQLICYIRTNFTKGVPPDIRQIVIRCSLSGSIVFLLLFNTSSTAYADEDTAARAPRIKAASIYYLTKFVRWPVSAFRSPTDPLTICLLGESSLTPFLQTTLAEKRVQGRRFKISQLAPDAEQSALSSCHTLLIGNLPVELLDSVLAKIHSLPILTISDQENFLKQGGTVQLYEQENKLKIRVKKGSAESKGLQLSSELLKIVELD